MLDSIVRAKWSQYFREVVLIQFNEIKQNIDARYDYISFFSENSFSWKCKRNDERLVVLLLSVQEISWIIAHINNHAIRDTTFDFLFGFHLIWLITIDHQGDAMVTIFHYTSSYDSFIDLYATVNTSLDLFQLSSDKGILKAYSGLNLWTW